MSFPLLGLDLTPYLLGLLKCSRAGKLFDLYVAVCHYVDVGAQEEH